MAVSLEQFSALVAAIHAGALEPGRREAALRAVVGALGGAGGAMLVAGPDGRRFRDTALGIDPGQMARYDAHYGALDPIVQVLKGAPVGTVLGNHQIINRDAMRHSEFYTDWARGVGSGDGIVTTLLRERGGIAWFICSAPLRNERFATEERLHLMGLLVPHLRQALRVELDLGTAGRRDPTPEAFEHLRHGVLWLAASGRIVHANAAATAILRQGQGLALGADGSLRAQLAAEHALLRRLLGRAGTGEAIRSGGSLGVSRPHGRAKLVVHLVPLGRETEAPGAAVALALIVDAGAFVAPPPGLLRQLYGLTDAEAATALAVLRAGSLQAAAQARGVSLSTVRTHLQRVYEKIGIHRLPDLARLLQALDGGIVPPGADD